MSTRPLRTSSTTPTTARAGDTLDPVYTDPAVQFDDIQFGLFRRCPGAGAPPAADGSNPFLDGGALGAGDCDPSALPPGP